LLIVLDDIHWADAKSRDLFCYLARHLNGHPFLLLGTCREQELAEDHTLSTLLASLQQERVTSTLTVPALSESAMRALLSHMPEPLIQSIQQRVAGNPFFAEELALLFATDDPLIGQKKIGTSPIGARRFLKRFWPCWISACIG
jgi:predicted ATPase